MEESALSKDVSDGSLIQRRDREDRVDDERKAAVKPLTLLVAAEATRIISKEEVENLIIDFNYCSNKCILSNERVVGLLMFVCVVCSALCDWNSLLSWSNLLEDE